MIENYCVRDITQVGALPEEIDEGLYALLGQVGEGGAHVAEQRPGEQLLPLLGQPQVRAGRLRELKYICKLQCISIAGLWAEAGRVA